MWRQSRNGALNFEKPVLGQGGVAEVSGNAATYADCVVDCSLAFQPSFDRQLQCMSKTAHRSNSGLIHGLAHVFGVVTQNNVNLLHRNRPS